MGDTVLWPVVRQNIIVDLVEYSCSAHGGQETERAATGHTLLEHRPSDLPALKNIKREREGGRMCVTCVCEVCMYDVCVMCVYMCVMWCVCVLEVEWQAVCEPPNRHGH